MKYPLVLLVLSSALAFAQLHHDVELNRRGDHEMGLSHEKTTHQFTLTRDGGSIEIRANSPADTASRDQIRSHFAHIVQMFSAGDFNVPMLVHGTKDVPGTSAMSRLKDQLHWNLQETPSGAKITITSDSKPALNAVHEFLRYQIMDHKTGDSTAIQ